MQQIRAAIRLLIQTTEPELDGFLAPCAQQIYKKGEPLSWPGASPQKIFFINKGITRTTILDHNGVEHTLHFTLENEFISDYTAFLQQRAGAYTIEALEETDAIILPREAIDWGYQHMAEGQKFGRVIAEHYFQRFDQRLRTFYTQTPKERYDAIDQLFANIHNRVPQHMIASYLGVSPVHLSRLKKAARFKT